MDKPRLIVIGGPTASGKSAAAVRLCQRIGGQVISSDSMQIYRGMDIGTAKPTEEEMGGIPHHLLSIAEPGEKYSAAAYRELATQAIQSVYASGEQPVVCGGTGLYIDALTKPMSFAEHNEDETLRKELSALSETMVGKMRLHQMLKEIDPESAARLHINDVRRVIRAIEVYRTTGRTITEQTRLDKEREGDYSVVMFALEWPREILYDRINKRVDVMIKNGLIDEVRTLLNNGLSEGSTAMQALGYKEIVAALNGRISMNEAIDDIKQGSRHYAKRQLTWFRRDERVHWIQASGKSLDQIVDEMIKEIESHA
ncbi:MAG: tRNA (adenosine(37)-N6)-dimethylallyltransferase MiaA [Clostridia bacterium]|nr:tRNA (adenosine(37)-N6)-dimethylallyltransferase MiaA [Clostridia bacterium]